MDSIDKYLKELYIKEDDEYIIETDLKAALSKMTSSKKTQSILKGFSKTLNNKNPIGSLKQISSKIKYIPTIKTSSIDKYLTPKLSEFKKLKNTANVILTNSVPNISKESNQLASTFLAISSMYTKKSEKNLSPNQKMKNNSKEFVMRVRKFMDDNDDEETSKSRGFQKEDLPDLAVAWVIVAMATALAIGMGTGIIMVTTAIAGFLPWAMLLLTVVAALALAGKIIGG